MDKAKEKRLYQTDYGYFDAETSEYVITRPDTPKPWINVICPGDYGLTVSQAGSGYSWRTHASLNRITRWNQDLVTDEWGKYLYIRDEADGSYWSAGWKPVCRKPDSYACRHGFGYTTLVSVNNGIQSEWTLFVPPDEPVEIWSLKLTNLTRRARSLSVWSYMEWCLGEGPDSHREFHRTFIETYPDRKRGSILAGKRLWAVPNAKGQHWNRSWDYTAWHAASGPVSDITGSKSAFIGQNGRIGAPQALDKGAYLQPTTGKWDDGVAGIMSRVKLAAGRSRTIHYTLGASKDRRRALTLSKKYQDAKAVTSALRDAREFWADWLERSRVDTPDEAFNLLADKWLKYQALSSRIWGRTAYYQAGGAYGYRDQLQDSQIFLHLDPERTRRQILMNASRQYKSGIVQHWWHPLSDSGLKSDYSDDLLWLPFIMAHYLRETGDFRLLKKAVPFLDDDGTPSKSTAPLYEHAQRAIATSLKNRSRRGLPLIGVGDWNDGLSAAGWDGKGESVWVGQFLFGVLNHFSEIIRHAVKQGVLPESEKKYISAYRREAEKLRKAVNKHGWDGQWYWAASSDDGTRLGSRQSKDCKIHLNPQTWAVMNGLVPEDRKKKVLQSLERMLYKKYGPLVLNPSYKTPDERVGYLTRYAPGVRENGGLYTHAGVWAVQMECFLKRREKAWKLFKSFCPVYRGMEPDLYQCEPYVTPGNVDGPDSPFFGRGGWTWYTGSAAWIYRIMTEWFIGVRPVWDGLLIDPCLPPHWDGYTFTRLYRGHTYRIRARVNKKKGRSRMPVLTLDGKPVDGNILPVPKGKRRKHEVEVIIPG